LNADYGELIPVGGGDTIPLLKPTLVVGRRESCDIVLRFTNVSSNHCQFSLQNGYWYVRDLNSTNGVKVNDVRISAEKRVAPGDNVTIAKHAYRMMYSPADLGAVGPMPIDGSMAEVLGKSLLERAGLTSDGHAGLRTRPRDKYNPLSNEAGQIKDPNKPV
jgi:adenylate cyclase